MVAFFDNGSRHFVCTCTVSSYTIQNATTGSTAEKFCMTCGGLSRSRVYVSGEGTNGRSITLTNSGFNAREFKEAMDLALRQEESIRKLKERRTRKKKTSDAQQESQVPIGVNMGYRPRSNP